ncbi:hypothetical protein ACWEWX_50565, partial [Streptomyces asiaticus]
MVGQFLLGQRGQIELARRRGMGMVFQAYSLFPTMTACDNVAYGSRLRGVGTRTRRRRAKELLELVGLASHDPYGHFGARARLCHESLR